MTWIAVGLVLLALLLGGAGMRKVGRAAGRAWRPGAGVLALGLFVAAAAFGVRQSWGPALVVFFIALMLSMSVRRPSWGRPEGGASRPPPRPGAMGREEARAILGVGSEATPQEVQAAYLRLIRLAHPDQGGTSGLAAQLNAARDVLLGKR